MIDEDLLDELCKRRLERRGWVVRKAAAMNAANLVDRIKGVTAERFGVRVYDLLGRGRTIHLTRARQAAIYVTRQLTALSSAEIGDEFGRRDHGTILWACKMIEREVAKGTEIAKTVQAIIVELRNSLH